MWKCPGLAPYLFPESHFRTASMFLDALEGRRAVALLMRVPNRTARRRNEPAELRESTKHPFSVPTARPGSLRSALSGTFGITAAAVRRPEDRNFLGSSHCRCPDGVRHVAREWRRAAEAADFPFAQIPTLRKLPFPSCLTCRDVSPLKFML